MEFSSQTTVHEHSFMFMEESVKKLVCSLGRLTDISVGPGGQVCPSEISNLNICQSTQAANQFFQCILCGKNHSRKIVPEQRELFIDITNCYAKFFAHTENNHSALMIHVTPANGEIKHEKKIRYAASWANKRSMK